MPLASECVVNCTRSPKLVAVLHVTPKISGSEPQTSIVSQSLKVTHPGGTLLGGLVQV